jgi:hypothetical protein
MLCWNCAEKRAKRTLTKDDLRLCPASADRYYLLTIKKRRWIRRKDARVMRQEIKELMIHKFYENDPNNY